MDSKRKINGGGGAVGDLEDRASKRRKLPDTNSGNGETAETTSQYGLQLLDQINKISDKSGRLVATDFLELPDKKELPDYYMVIKMPIALDIIEAKLKRREFPSLTSLESYFSRMVANAKEYNEEASEIVDDAERIGKAVGSFMAKHNPAYKTPGYSPYPTPIPGEQPSASESLASDDDADGEVDTDVPASTPSTFKRRPGRPPKNPFHPSHPNQLANQVASGTPTRSVSQASSSASFSGLSFQQAQEKIVTDCLLYKEDPTDDFVGFEPFVTLPPRTLRDYYQVIPHPVSLKSLQKKVRGIHGRNEITGASDFKSWKSFEEEASSIWKNAWHYNEDGSDISLLAKELETFFIKRLTDAKQAVQEPPQPKLKLKVSSTPAESTPKITLRMGGKASPADSPAPSTAPNGTPATEQAQNGVGLRRNPFGGSQNSSNSLPTLSHLDRAHSMSGSLASPSPSTPAIKNEDLPKPSPAILPTTTSFSYATQLSHQQTASPYMNGVGMAPPSGNNSNYNGLVTNGLHSAQPAYQTPNTSFESKWRQAGKDASDAMITNLSLATHPGLNISRHFRMDLPPSGTMAQQSITINLPATHYYLQIKPTIAAALLERQHKLFVTSGTQRLHGMPTIPGQAVDPRNPLFEARLLPGVNRIEVELIAALPKGAPKPANGQDVELEKITVFANLLRT